ncbi:MAG: biopolymer transporter Tol [Pirellulales bacterium]
MRPQLANSLSANSPSAQSWRAACVALAVFTLIATVASATVRCCLAGETEAKYLDNIHQVTEGFTKAGEGYFSPDAGTIIYQAVPRDYIFYQIYTQDLADGQVRRISPGRGRTTCAYFAPSGDKVIFASSHLDPQIDATEQAERDQQAEDAKTGRRRRYNWDFDPYLDIFEANPDGSELRQLTDSPGYDAEGSYSPDGSQIVFCSDRDGDPDLYIMDADGGNVRQLTNAPGYDGGPFFSPDGEWVVFRSDRKKEGFLQIYVIRTDGTQETALTDNKGVNWALTGTRPSR